MQPLQNSVLPFRNGDFDRIEVLDFKVDAAFGLQIEFQDYSTFLKYAPIKRVSHLLAIAWTY